MYEKGVSGFKKSAKERDAIVELQTMALQNEFDVLLVYMFDRLGRRDDETPFIVEWFVRNGIEVWSTKEGQRRFDSHIDKLLNYITFWQASAHEAQRLMKARATHHGDTPLNMAGHALMKGNIFCGHCRNRLTMATSGHKRIAKDGTVSRQTHFRYQCRHGVRHPNDCDGQSTYSVDKLDAIVEQVVLYQLSKIQTADGRKAVNAAYRARLDQAQRLCARIRQERDSKQAELADYQAEVLQVIRGNSAFTQETLMPLITQTQAEIERLEVELDQAESELRECQQSAERELSELQTLQTWAKLYKTCSFDERKIIVSRLMRRLHVYRGYRMEIEFNVSFEDFWFYNKS